MRPPPAALSAAAPRPPSPRAVFSPALLLLLLLVLLLPFPFPFRSSVSCSQKFTKTSTVRPVAAPRRPSYEDGQLRHAREIKTHTLAGTLAACLPGCACLPAAAASAAASNSVSRFAPLASTPAYQQKDFFVIFVGNTTPLPTVLLLLPPPGLRST